MSFLPLNSGNKTPVYIRERLLFTLPTNFIFMLFRIKHQSTYIHIYLFGFRSKRKWTLLFFREERIVCIWWQARPNRGKLPKFERPKYEWAAYSYFACSKFGKLSLSIYPQEFAHKHTQHTHTYRAAELWTLPKYEQAYPLPARSYFSSFSSSCQTLNSLRLP